MNFLEFELVTLLLNASHLFVSFRSALKFIAMKIMMMGKLYGQ